MLKVSLEEHFLILFVFSERLCSFGNDFLLCTKEMAVGWRLENVENPCTKHCSLQSHHFVVKGSPFIAMSFLVWIMLEPLSCWCASWTCWEVVWSLQEDRHFIAHHVMAMYCSHWVLSTPGNRQLTSAFDHDKTFWDSSLPWAVLLKHDGKKVPKKFIRWGTNNTKWLARFLYKHFLWNTAWVMFRQDLQSSLQMRPRALKEMQLGLDNSSQVLEW